MEKTRVNLPLGTIKNAARLKKIVGVFAKNGFENLAERAKLGKFIFEKVTSSTVRKLSAPERLRISFEELGPTFVKLGQILATRPDLIPHLFCEEFKKLHSQVSEVPFSDIKPVLQGHFGEDLTKVFTFFNEKPIGAASIAQVYEAKLIDGSPVVVKVQKPDIEDVIYEDLGVIYFLAEVLETYIPESRLFNPVGVANEFFKTLELELNFIVEANNIKRFQNNFKNFEKVVIPEVYLQYSGKKVLVQEQLQGKLLSDPHAISKDVDGEELIKTGLRCYFKMVFKDGMFHGDMHPGNMFILPNNKLGLIDFGVVGRLNDKTKSAIANMLIALATEDYDSLAYEYVDLAPYSEFVDVDKLSRQLRNLIAPYHGLKLDEVNSGRLLLESTAIAAENKVILPSELVVFFKSIIAVEGMGRIIKKDFDVL
ncbi:MAG: AarF/ABC1/UbiB kinase family protein, partial [Bdellovibrionales bacterium]|nr:AarF/ABC1/UbiB kinase family protein [Bdellovibrionales bacterium]